MKNIKILIPLLLVCFCFSSCIVSYIPTDKLRANYEKKINHTTFLGKVLFKTDKKQSIPNQIDQIENN